MSVELKGLAGRLWVHMNARHKGAARGVTGRRLAEEVGASEREVREAITELRDAGVPVCAHPHTGYFLAETREEVERTCAFLRDRALHSLRLESRLRKVPIGDLVGQLQLDLQEDPP